MMSCFFHFYYYVTVCIFSLGDNVKGLNLVPFVSLTLCAFQQRFCILCLLGLWDKKRIEMPAVGFN